MAKIPQGVSDLAKQVKQPTPYMRLKSAKNEEVYWSARVRIDTKSLNRTLERYAQVLEVIAKIEAEIREAKEKKNETRHRPKRNRHEVSNRQVSQGEPSEV